MDSQLEAVQHRVRTVEGRIVKTEQDLAAAAEQAKNKENERALLDLLLSLNNQLIGLQEEKNILLRSQAASKQLWVGECVCSAIYWLLRGTAAHLAHQFVLSVKLTLCILAHPKHHTSESTSASLTNLAWLYYI